MHDFVRSTARAELKTTQEIAEIERERLVAEERTPLSSRIVPVLALLVALWWAKAVVIPIVLSILLSYALEPIVARMGDFRIRRAFAAPLLLLAFGLAAGGLGYALRGEAAGFLDRVPSAIHVVSEKFRQLSDGAPGPLAKMKNAANELETASHGAPDGVPAVRVEQPTFRWSDWVWQGSRSAVEFGAQMFAVLCITYCLLAAGDLYKRKLVHVVPTLSSKKITVQILAEIDRQIERFLMARATISAIIGVAFAVTFHFAGMQQAGVWGVISAVLFTIPIVGPTLFTVLAALAAFVQFGTVAAVSGIVVLCLVISAIEGNVLTPWLMSRAGEMNGAAVFVSLLFWGWIWGGWGLLLAVPITASIKAVCERVPDLSAFAEILKP